MLRTAVLLAVLAGPMLHAAEPRHVSFSSQDWDIACDNTGTCRAAGYQAEDR